MGLKVPGNPVDTKNVEFRLAKSLGWFSRTSKRERERPPVRRVSATRPADNNGIGEARSFLWSQDAYLQQVGGALDQMGLLAGESQDSKRTPAERAVLQEEFETLAGYITDIATKDFDNAELFTGALLLVTLPGNDGVCQIPGISLTLPVYNHATSTKITTPADALEASKAIAAAVAQLETDRASIAASEKELFSVNDRIAVLN